MGSTKPGSIGLNHSKIYYDEVVPTMFNSRCSDWFKFIGKDFAVRSNEKINSVEVRCCCNPKRLLGTIPVTGELRAGQPIKFPLLPKTEGFYEHEHLTLELHEFWHSDLGEDYEIKIALKAEGEPIEKLRRIVGFKEYLGAGR